MFNRYVLCGNMYEIGYKQGEIFSKSINEEIGIYEKTLENENISMRVDRIIEKIQNDLPNCFDELCGRADGAKVNKKALILMHSPELYEMTDGCTSAIYKMKDRVLFSHNEDDNGFNHDNTALFKFVYDNHWTISFTTYRKLSGSCFAYNSYGLVFSGNYLFHEKVNLNYLSRYIVTRDIIESKNIEECISKLKKNRTASPFSYNILDINTNEAINIEHDIEKDYITGIEGKYARSNHFLNKEKPMMSKSSENRNIIANKRISKLDEKAKIRDLIAVLAYEDEDYNKCILKDPRKSNGKESVTIANMAIDSKEREIIITDYLDHSTWKHSYNEF